MTGSTRLKILLRGYKYFYRHTFKFKWPGMARLVFFLFFVDFELGWKPEILEILEIDRFWILGNIGNIGDPASLTSWNPGNIGNRSILASGDPGNSGPPDI